MKDGSYVDYLFGVATGWLGWPPETAWRTPIPQIMLALTAHLDWMNPGPAPAKGAPPAKRGNVAERLKAFLTGRRDT